MLILPTSCLISDELLEFSFKGCDIIRSESSDADES